MTEFDRNTAAFRDPYQIEVQFPDWVSADTMSSDRHGSPRKSWMELARQKAQSLGISLEMEKSEYGAVIVRTPSKRQAASLFEAIQPDWQDALLEGLKGNLWVNANLACIMAVNLRTSEDIEHFLIQEMQSLADLYDLEFEVLYAAHREFLRDQLQDYISLPFLERQAISEPPLKMSVTRVTPADSARPAYG